MPISALAFLSAFGAFVIAALLSSGAWSFYLYQIVYYVNPAGKEWRHAVPSVPWSFLTVALMAAFAVFRVNRRTLHGYWEVAPVRWMLAIFVLYVIVLLYAVDRELHLVALIDLAKLFVTLTLAWFLLDTPAKLRMSLWVCVLGAAYLGWEAQLTGRDAFGRVEGIGPVDSPDSNGAAAALAPAVVFVLYFLTTGTLREKLLAVVLGFWIVTGLVLFNSRGAFLAVIAGSGYLLLYIVLSKRLVWRQRASAVLFVGIGLIGAVQVTDDTFWSRMDTLTELKDEATSGSHRYRMWLSAINLAFDHPSGVGASGFQKLSPEYVDRTLFAPGQDEKAVHSMWFQALAELGWLGLVLLIGLVLACFRCIRRIRRTPIRRGSREKILLLAALQGALLTYLVAGTFIDQFRAQILYWMILFVASAYRLYVMERVRAPRPRLSGGSRRTMSHQPVGVRSGWQRRSPHAVVSRRPSFRRRTSLHTRFSEMPS